MLFPEFDCGCGEIAGTLPQEELKSRVLYVRDENSASCDLEFAACLLSD